MNLKPNVGCTAFQKAFTVPELYGTGSSEFRVSSSLHTTRQTDQDPTALPLIQLKYWRCAAGSYDLPTGGHLIYE